jgi:anthranilate phosphoribosyltransferase
MKDALNILLDGRDLSQAQAESLLRAMLAPDARPAQIAGVLVALRAKGHTAPELAGFARAMRDAAIDPGLPADDAHPARPPRPTIDIVGTGGDSSGSLNISTLGALICASTGLVRVAKHGNRALSSACGSADVLGALGLPMPLAPRAAAHLLARTGFTFLFAPHYHGATGAVQAVRRELGVRTIFNLLGPLTNPARPGALLIGAYDRRACELLHRAAGLLGLRAMVVTSRAPAPEGAPDAPDAPERWCDEITPCGPFIEAIDADDDEGSVAFLEHDPALLGVPIAPWSALSGADAQANAQAMRRAVQPGGAPSPFLHAALLTSAYALASAGVCAGDVRHSYAQAARAVDDGRALALIEQLSQLAPELAALNDAP